MAVNGNGGSHEYVDSMGQTVTETGPRPLPSFADMSSQQRSASMDATVAQVAALTEAFNALSGRLNAYKFTYNAADDAFATAGAVAGYNRMVDRVIAIEQRLDALARVTAARWSLPFLSRLRWFIVGR